MHLIEYKELKMHKTILAHILIIRVKPKGVLAVFDANELLVDIEQIQILFF